MSELLMILAVALVVFGPRKLPQIGRTIGESLAQFRRASEDFKRSWEQEVTVEEKKLSASTPAPSSAPAIKEEPVSGTPGGQAAAASPSPTPSVKEELSHEDHSQSVTR